MSAPWYDPRIARGMAAQLTRWHELQKAGHKAIGWKVGFGSPAAMESLKITAPLVGYLLSTAELETGAKVSLAGWHKPAAEAEIAVTLGKTLAGGASRETAKAAISGIAPAIELADVDAPPTDVAAILAGNIYQRHVILGKPDRTRAGGNLDGVTAIIHRNGVEHARTTDTQAATGDLIDIVRHVADLLGAFGEQLKAGQTIITGSITPPLWVEPGEELAFALEPVGMVAARFKSAA